ALMTSTTRMGPPICWKEGRVSNPPAAGGLLETRCLPVLFLLQLLADELFGIFARWNLGDDAGDGAQVVLLGAANHMRGIQAGRGALDTLEQKLPHRDHGAIAYPEVFLRAVVDGPHAFGGAGIMDEKRAPHAGESFTLLFFAVLQI